METRLRGGEKERIRKELTRHVIASQCRQERRLSRRIVT